MGRFFINTFVPLAASPAGRRASKEFQLPPFIDGSIRREPDLEHAFPSISCLCRAGAFAPRLGEGDVVAYLTRKGRYGAPEGHRRLVAILRVIRCFESHDDAAAWYCGQGLPVPSNCMVEGNWPNPVAQSHRINTNKGFPDEEFTRRWDIEYRHRSRKHGEFRACAAIWIDVQWSAPKIHDNDLVAVFGKIPGTQNPGAHPIKLLEVLMERFGIAAPPSSP